MRSQQQNPGHDQGDEHPAPQPLDPTRKPGHGPWLAASLTITEAAQRCGVSASTIRRYLAAGRFPTARPRPSPVPGQRPQWRIPTDDLLRAGLSPQAGAQHDQAHEPQAQRTAGHDAHNRIRELEHAVEVERACRHAAEHLAAERAHTIQTLERALQALQTARAGAADAKTTPPSWSPSAERSRAGGEPVRPPGMLPMLPRPRPPKRGLSQEERAAIIGRALSRQPPPKRRWLRR